MTPRPLTRATILGVRPGALVRRIREEAVVLVLDENRFLAVTEVGARVLDLLDGHTPLGEILARLQDEYDVDAGRLESDVLAFLERLLLANVVEAT